MHSTSESVGKLTPAQAVEWSIDESTCKGEQIGKDPEGVCCEYHRGIQVGWQKAVLEGESRWRGHMLTVERLEKEAVDLRARLLSELAKSIEAKKLALPLDADKSVLRSQEVCAIIRTCGQANVAEIKFRDLEVRFTTPGESARNPATPAGPETATQLSVDPARSKEIEQDTLERDELRVKQQRVDELPIADPLEYENQLAAGELTDDVGGDEDEA